MVFGLSGKLCFQVCFFSVQVVAESEVEWFESESFNVFSSFCNRDVVEIL